MGSERFISRKPELLGNLSPARLSLPEMRLDSGESEVYAGFPERKAVRAEWIRATLYTNLGSSVMQT